MAETPQHPGYRILTRQMVEQRDQARYSARKILGLLFEKFQPQSVLDVGCGIGAWLATAKELGIPVTHGVEGEWLDRKKLLIDPAFVFRVELERGFSLGRRYDLAICLEVAEHLSPAAAQGLVDSLVAHAPVVLFSAAIPFQSGPGHVNEQWPYYWASKFLEKRYAMLDFLRGPIWGDEQVLWWYRQNTLVYVDYAWAKTVPGLWRQIEIERALARPVDIVYPPLYLTLAARLRKLEETLLQGGPWSVSQDDHGVVHLKKIEPDQPCN